MYSRSASIRPINCACRVPRHRPLYRPLSQIGAGEYDFLVLQEQSQVGGMPSGFPQRDDSMASLSSFYGQTCTWEGGGVRSRAAAHNHTPPIARRATRTGPQAALHSATVVLLETYGVRTRDTTPCCSAIFSSFGAMQAKLTLGYDRYRQARGELARRQPLHSQLRASGPCCCNITGTGERRCDCAGRTGR